MGFESLLKAAVCSHVHCQLAVSLGLDESDSTKQNLEVYRQDFEKAFLAAMELYYKTESETFIRENSVTDYMRKAEVRLREEEGRVEMYLHPSTTNKASCVSAAVPLLHSLTCSSHTACSHLRCYACQGTLVDALGRVPGPFGRREDRG